MISFRVRTNHYCTYKDVDDVLGRKTAANGQNTCITVTIDDSSLNRDGAAFRCLHYRHTQHAESSKVVTAKDVVCE